MQIKPTSIVFRPNNREAKSIPQIEVNGEPDTKRRKLILDAEE